ncbi:ThiF family adenylyltransferase [Vibrio ostreicida]|uniref:HesA/MoeB/ThiF family protein n=1 Tax=Vibrio ostreicida TaxID=526588 RepID=A0ABT8BWG7_9VIBR|nr:HesA/MoeB/ThiF family protein [Vibrio ostreicida]MDN3610447.1 HesA/MoeB/ThiF family protein [Vibrio ostreicida]NPD07549.1 hypothetical protein [Vibrio ostreicida]
MRVGDFQLFVRQISLSGFGMKGQAQLHKASILVVGAGGLGCPVLQSLSAMGVGNLGIIDGDEIEASNLHRQMLYTQERVGEYKANVAAEIVGKLGIKPKVEVWTRFLDEALAQEVFPHYDLIIDATDNFDSKYLIDVVAAQFGLPVCYASVNQYEGQIALFGAGHDWLTYTDAFPSRLPQTFTSSCSDSGVLGVIPAIVGAYQALFAVLYLTGQHDHLKDKIFYLNTAIPILQSVSISKNNNPIPPRVDSSGTLTCSTPSAIEIRQLAKINGNATIIDVREPHERTLRFRKCHHYPLKNPLQWLEKLNNNETYIFVCQSGKRSLGVAQEARVKGLNAYSYFGGMNQALKMEKSKLMEIIADDAADA